MWDEAQWSGLLAPGAGRVVIQQSMGPRREIPFVVPETVPEGKKWVELVLVLN